MSDDAHIGMDASSDSAISVRYARAICRNCGIDLCIRLSQTFNDPQGE
jgi:hypothetical protein